MARMISSLLKQNPPRALALGLLVLASAFLFACPPQPPPPTPPKITAAKITAPENGKIFNAGDDEDKTRPDIQVTIKVELTVEGDGFPEGVEATLTSNGKNPAKVSVASATISYQGYTLQNGSNILQVSVKLSDGTSVNSETIEVTAGSANCGADAIKIAAPLKDALLGARDDEETSKPGFQQTVIVKVDKKYADAQVSLSVKDAQGKETLKLQDKPFDGEVGYPAVTLPEGDVTLTATVEDSVGNVCTDEIKLKVRLGAPAVEITSPAEGQKLCPKDDKDPNEPGFQMTVTVKTSAEDKSEATLFLDGLKHKGPTIVSGGQVTFDIALPTIKNVIQNKIQVKITDTLGNTGESKERTIDARARGYSLALIGVLDGQTIAPSRDEDKAAPGIQLTIKASTSAPDGTEISLDQDGTAVKAAAKNGVANFKLTLKEGKNCIKASATEPSCSVTSESSEVCLNIDPIGQPTLSCSLSEKSAPPFGPQKGVSLNPSHDADDQTAGLQNSLKCQTDAEKDQPIELTISGNPVQKSLVDGPGGTLREAVFDKLTFPDGVTTATVKVTNKLGKTATATYTIRVDTSAPAAPTTLAGTVEDHRKASVKLSWVAPADTGQPHVPRYEIRYTSLLKDITTTDWDKPEGKQSTTATKKAGETVEFVVSNLSVGKTYIFAVRAVDAAGNKSEASKTFTLKIDFKTNTTTEPATNQVFGFHVSVVGDLDKDGILDTVVCEPRYQDAQGNAAAGAAHIYYGRAISTGSYLASKPDVTIWGEDRANAFCQTAIGMGDLNGDGFDDFAVRAQRAASNMGRVYIFFGGQRNTSLKNGNAASIARVVITGTDNKAAFAYSIAAAGVGTVPDLNGDSKADLLVSAPLSAAGTYQGRVYIFYSRAAYPSSTQPPLQLDTSKADVIITNNSIANNARSLFGTAMAVGDIDKDGKADIVVGAQSADTVLGFFGDLKPTNKVVNSSAANFKIDGSKTGGASFGSHISIAGDVDKDNKLELLVSALKGTAPGRASQSGQVFLFSGARLTRGATKLLADTGSSANWYGQVTATFLNVTSPAGDVNKDGFDDFLIGEGLARDSSTNRQGVGAVYLFFGGRLTALKSGEANASADVRWYGSASKAQLGIYGIVGGVDVTKDGFVDILMVESPNINESIKGKLYLRY